MKRVSQAGGLVEKLEEWFERLDNLCHAMELPMAADVHLQALREALPEIRDDIEAELEKWVAELGDYAK